MSVHIPCKNAPSALTRGDVRRQTLALAFPGMGAMLASGAANLLDGLLAARAGTQAACAASVVFPLLSLLQALGFTLGMGAGSFASRSLGRGEGEAASRVASTALLAAAVLGGALGLLLSLFPAPLVSFLGAPAQAASACILYARFVLAASPLLCAQLVLGSLLRAQGETRPGLVSALAGCASGAALSAFLTLRLRLGVVGLGAGLLLREGVTLFLLAVFARRKSALRLSPRLLTLRPWVLSAILRSGLPTLIRQGLTSVGSALLSRVGSGFGAPVLAGMGVAVRAGALVSSAVIGFSQGLAPVCGVNFGAGKLDRVRAAYAFALRAAIPSLALLGALAFALSPGVARALGASAEAAAFAALALRAQSVTFFAAGAVILMGALPQTLGLTARATLVSSSRQGLFFIPLLFLLPPVFGETGLALCQSASDLLSLGFSWLLTRRAIDKAAEKGIQ